MGKKTSIPAPVGGSSLLVIFAVLCLTVFALLELATVKADERLADDSYRAVSAYYEADCEAERILGELREGNLPDGVSGADGRYTYVCPISDTQQLCVSVALNGTDYEVYEWKVEETIPWTPDDTIDLIDIDDFTWEE